MPPSALRSLLLVLPVLILVFVNFVLAALVRASSIGGEWSGYLFLVASGIIALGLLWFLFLEMRGR